MGFTNAVTALAAGAGATQSFLSYNAYKDQSKQLNAVAAQQEASGMEHAQAITQVAMANARRSMRNASNELGRARLDASASNLVASGSVALREADLASRLQDEIALTTDRALQEAYTTQTQAIFDAQNTRMSATAARQQATSSIFSGGTALLGAMAKF